MPKISRLPQAFNDPQIRPHLTRLARRHGLDEAEAALLVRNAPDAPWTAAPTRAALLRHLERATRAEAARAGIRLRTATRLALHTDLLAMAARTPERDLPGNDWRTWWDSRAGRDWLRRLAGLAHANAKNSGSLVENRRQKTTGP